MASRPLTIRLRVCLRILSIAAFTTLGIKVKITPVDRVVSLLRDLSSKIAAEGKIEAAQYDKYACFCKEQIENKQTAVERAQAKISHFKAQIGELETARVRFVNQQKQLNEKIAELVRNIGDITDKHSIQHNEYVHTAKDMSEAIGMCDEAVAVIKSSQKQMLGSKVDLVHVTSRLVRAMKGQPLLTQAPGAMAFFSKVTPKIEIAYQPNDIIATVQDLKANFVSMKKSLDEDEFNAKAVFEKTRLGLLNEKSFAEKEIAEKESRAESAIEKLQTAKVSKEEEEQDYHTDGHFLESLKLECANKARLFDDRSKVRASELTALTQATEELEKGAVPNYPVALMQYTSTQHQHSHGTSTLQQVHSLLADAAERLDSRYLSNIAFRTRNPDRCRIVCTGPQKSTCQRYCPDPFENVRSMIEDLLAKLKDDLVDEKERKEECDKVMKRRVGDRDSANQKIETATGNLDVFKADQQMVVQDIDFLNKEILDLRKGLVEFNMLSAEDVKIRKNALDMSEQGIKAVTFALEALSQQFDVSFAEISRHTSQKPHEHTVTGVSGIAPDIFERPYQGATVEPKGIIAILELILADFKRSKDAVVWDKEQAARYGLKFEKDTAADIKIKTEKVDKNKGVLADITAEITEEEQALRDGKMMLKNTLSALEDWQSDCVEQGETWEERKQKRDSEIQALKQAHAILDEQQT